MLRTGDLRDSIEFTIIAPGKHAEIGSNSDIAVYQELGTATIPARSFLAAAAAGEGKHVAEVTGKVVQAAMLGRSIEGEIAKLLIETLRDLKHTREELLEEHEKLQRLNP